jgi:hypothetical protein
MGEHGRHGVLHCTPETLCATVLLVRISTRKTLQNSGFGTKFGERAMGVYLFVVCLDQVDAGLVVGELLDQGRKMLQVDCAAIFRPAAVSVGVSGFIVNKYLDEALAGWAGGSEGAVPVSMNKAEGWVAGSMGGASCRDVLVMGFAVGAGCAWVQMFA